MEIRLAMLGRQQFRAHRSDEDTEWSIFEVEYKLDNEKVITTRRFG